MSAIDRRRALLRAWLAALPMLCAWLLVLATVFVGGYWWVAAYVIPALDCWSLIGGSVCEPAQPSASMTFRAGYGAIGLMIVGGVTAARVSGLRWPTAAAFTFGVGLVCVGVGFGATFIFGPPAIFIASPLAWIVAFMPLRNVFDERLSNLDPTVNRRGVRVLEEVAGWILVIGLLLGGAVYAHRLPEHHAPTSTPPAKIAPGANQPIPTPIGDRSLPG